MNICTFLSGLFGVIIGAIFTYIFTLIANRKSLFYDAKLKAYSKLMVHLVNNFESSVRNSSIAYTNEIMNILTSEVALLGNEKIKKMITEYKQKALNYFEEKETLENNDPQKEYEIEELEGGLNKLSSAIISEMIIDLKNENIFCGKLF